LSKGEGVNKYIYRDNREMPSKVIFKCQAKNILEADALYRKATKNDPVKQPYVGCEPIPAHEPVKR
jgi:hypothetical protein